MAKPVFRFAPSPNGHLHLGHAYSALLNLKMARELGGKCLLRIEDIDTLRCTPELEAQMLSDLEWIGFEWDEKPRRQSEHFNDYGEALKKLQALDLIYPSALSRSEIKKSVADKKEQGIDWQSDPDGTPLYPGNERHLDKAQQLQLIKAVKNYALRLDSKKANDLIKHQLSWIETSSNKNITANPLAWGDVILARKDYPASYHLCCTIDDALQGITHVVRGMDLYHATSVHILLSHLLNLPKPVYHHHKLIMDKNAEKLSKSKKHESLKNLRASGYTKNQMLEELNLTL